MIGFMYSFTEILSLFDTVPNYVRIILFLFIFLIYEPLLVSLFGQSIGHSYIKIKVVRDDESQKNISFPKSKIFGPKKKTCQLYTPKIFGLLPPSKCV